MLKKKKSHKPRSIARKLIHFRHFEAAKEILVKEAIAMLALKVIDKMRKSKSISSQTKLRVLETRV